MAYPKARLWWDSFMENKSCARLMQINLFWSLPHWLKVEALGKAYAWF